MSSLEIRRLNSPGPIADRFLASRAFVQIIIGPVGSAKTVTALRKLRRIGQMQGGRVDGNGVLWRKARVGVLREVGRKFDRWVDTAWWQRLPRQ